MFNLISQYNGYIMKSILLLSLYLFVVALGISSCSVHSNGLSNARKESLYDRVLASGKIRAAYGIYPPFCMKDPNFRRMSGIGVDALELVAKKLGLTIEYTEEVGWGSMVEGLQANRYDIIACPLWTNPSRARVAWFSKPLCFHPVFAYARKGDKRFQRIENINSPRITTSSIDGTTEDLIAHTDFPNAKHLTMPQLTDISQSFLNLTSKKADIVLAEPGFASRFMKTNPNTIENIDPMSPLRIYSVCYIFKRGESEFKAMLDTVLDEVINSGEMERIIRKYETNKNAIFLVAKPYQAIH